MNQSGIRALSGISLLLAPLLLAQGLWVRWRTPRLPGAAGPDTGTVEAAGADFRLLTLGESTVAGIGAPTHDEALTGQVAASLAHRLKRTIHWRAAGQNGLTAHRLLTELVPSLPDEKADAIVVALGVNDVLSLSSAAKWTGDLTALVAAVRSRCGHAPVVLAGVPPMNHFPALPQPLRAVLGQRSQMLDAAAAQLAVTLAGVIHAPMNFAGGAEFFCADRFHPSALGYKMWGDHLAETIAAFTQRL